MPLTGTSNFSGGETKFQILLSPGSHRRRGASEGHQRIQLLHAAGRVPSGQVRVEDAAELPDVQDELLQVRGTRRRCRWRTSQPGVYPSRFGDVQLDFRNPAGFDRTRNVEIGNKNIKLKHLEEAYTSEHWLVRIYRYRMWTAKVEQ